MRTIFLQSRYCMRAPIACMQSRFLRLPGKMNPNVFRRPLLLPPIELQEEFAESVKVLEKLKATQRASLADLDTLFASLQQRAFSGEL